MSDQLTATTYPDPAQWWSVRLAFQCSPPLTTTGAENLHRALEPVHGAVSMEESSRVSVQTSVRAITLDAAVAYAVPLATEALRRTGVHTVLQVIDALSEDEFDLQQEQADAERRIPDVYGHQEIAAVLDITPAQAAELVRSKDWKKVTTPVCTLRSGPLYTLSQIQEYQASRTGTA
jgi:hypothetical protein